MAQANVSITTPSTDNGALVSSSSTKNLFITPKLATTGENVQFEAKVRSSYSTGSVKVYSITDNVAAAETTTNEEFEALTPTLLGEFTIGTDVTSFTTYSVEAPAGEYYLAFKIANAQVDEIYGMTVIPVEHDWMIASSNIPAEAMQNVTTTATVNILNLGLADEAADSYTVTAYVNGEVAGTGEAVAIPMNHKLSDAGTQLSVSYHSPKAGTFPVYIEVKAGEYSVATDPVSVTFAKETASADGIQVGTQTSTGQYFGFVDWYNNDGSTTNYTDILYPADKISAAGIKAGDKITAISFKASNSAKTFKAEVTSWVGTSTGNITYGTPDKTAMQEIVVYSGSVNFPANVESVITLKTPIVWDGTSDIRVYTEAIGQGNGNWMYAYYAYDSDMTMSYNGTTKAAPLAYFTLAVEPKTYSGTVKDDSGNAIENATVTLVSTDGDNIQYTGTTNADGEFSINVIQSSRTYNATVSAYGYDNGIDNGISFDVDKVFELVPSENVSVTVTAAGWATITTPATYAVSFDEKTEVYIATGENGESITLKKISDAPAMTPVVIHATAGDYTMTKIANASPLAENILQSSDGTITGDYNSDTKESTYYVLGKNSSDEVGFAPLAKGVKLAKGKAYIHKNDWNTANAVEFLPFVIGDEDETTSISEELRVKSEESSYNLSGQKVGKDYKGVVIVNGKKVIRK